MLIKEQYDSKSISKKVLVDVGAIHEHLNSPINIESPQLSRPRRLSYAIPKSFNVLNMPKSSDNMEYPLPSITDNVHSSDYSSSFKDSMNVKLMELVVHDDEPRYVSQTDAKLFSKIFENQMVQFVCETPISDLDDLDFKYSLVITDNQLRIISTSTHTEDLLGYKSDNLVGISLLSIFTPLYRKKLENIILIHSLKLHHDPIKKSSNDTVYNITLYNDLDTLFLLFGKMMRIVCADGATKSVSVWMKGFRSGSGIKYGILIRDILVTTIKVQLETFDDQPFIPVIIASDESQRTAFSRLFGYEGIERVPLTSLIPSMNKNLHCFSNSNHIDSGYLSMIHRYILKKRFFLAFDDQSNRFPIIFRPCIKYQSHLESENVKKHMLEIVSLSNVSSIVKISEQSGLIRSCSSAFMKYLFGYKASQLIDKASITNIVPEFFDFYTIKKGNNTNNHNDSTDSFVLNASNVSHKIEGSRSLNTTPLNSVVSCTMHARHSTGFTFPCELQIIMPNSGPILHDYHTEDISDRTLIVRIHYSRPTYVPTLRESDPDVLQLLESPSLEPSTSIDCNSNDTLFQMSPSPEALDPLLPPHLAMLLNEKCFPNNIQDYKVIKCLGEGAYGSVHLVSIRKDPVQKRFVMKKILKEKILPEEWIKLSPNVMPPEYLLQNPDQMIKSTSHESCNSYNLGDPNFIRFPIEIHILDLLRKHPHPYLLDMTFYFEDDTYYYVLSEMFGTGMDLFEFIDRTSGYLSLNIVKNIFWQTVKAVQHLHRLKVIHRDLKDENIVIDHRCNIKVIDFGSAAFYQTGKSFGNFCGTIEYAPPEVLKGKPYEGPAQDIWALGVLLYTIQFKENPFKTRNETIFQPLHIPFIPHKSREMIELMSWMLEKDEKKRPTLDQILSHPFFLNDQFDQYNN